MTTSVLLPFNPETDHLICPIHHQEISEEYGCGQCNAQSNDPDISGSSFLTGNTVLENALAVYPNYIHFECGHTIEATIGMIESLDDGTDLSECPACAKRTRDLERSAAYSKWLLSEMKRAQF
jgi:DNA-directed RNA polymerase subunit RPC12/RpoP